MRLADLPRPIRRVIAGLIMMVVARVVLQSSFFQIRRESAPGQRH
jgi:hypothetical protein